MRYITFFVFFLLQSFSFISSAQTILTDTFIRKDGIHLVPEFEPWETATLFRIKSSKNKQVGSQPLLPLEACDRVKYYSSNLAEKKTEPFRFFRVLNDLAAHDSDSYFQYLTDLPTAYQSFFKGLYFVEYNEFKTALPLFDNVFSNGADSLLMKEPPFWKEATTKMLNEQLQHNTVLAAYSLLEQPRIDSARLMALLQQVTLPQYVMHKYISLYNYNYRKKNYEAARVLYDSVVAYASSSKIKASLAKHRVAVQEMLDGKEKFMTAMRNKLYHYEVDYLYDHLQTWGQDTLTDKEFSALAGFTLEKRYTTKTDSIFTRRLVDTAVDEPLSKFEMLSLIRTPPDRGGRRFVIVKLGFDNEDTWNKYVSFLSKFKSKDVHQSVLYNKTSITEGNEYMLTKHFIAALYKQDDPVIKYELSLYLIQDAEGNVYAVDTLF
jgi:hypothetical protein